MPQRFEKREDCYYDTKTGLEWSLENYGPMSWEQAVEFCKKLDGWRLPTFKELLTLVDYEKTKPATKLPRMVDKYYWSSTTDAISVYTIWCVHFNHGHGDWSDKYNGNYVRAVRGGPLRYQV